MTGPVDPIEEVERFVFLRDQQELTPAESAAADAARGWIAETLATRSERLRELAVDETIGMPQGNWHPGQPFFNFSRALAEGRNFPLLRIYGPHFTGVPLHTMGTAIELPKDSLSVESLDELLAPYADRPDDSVVRYATLADRLPEYLHISPPQKFGEVGWRWRGKIVNHDTVAYLERLALLYEIGLLDRDDPKSLLKRDDVTIVEIGSGYGGLACFIRQLLPNARYIAVDLPESLAYSSIYLSAMFHDEQLNYGLTPETLSRLQSHAPGFTFVPNYEFGVLVDSGIHADLCINTLSMSEMNKVQVKDYCIGIRQMIRKDGRFFEQNQDNRKLGLLHAQKVIKRHFRHVCRLGGPKSQPPLMQGYANVWSNSKLPKRLASRKVFGAPMDPAAPQVLESRRKFNIVLFRRNYYCVPLSAGAVDFTNDDLSAIAGMIVCESLEDSRQAIDRVAA